MKIFTLAWNWPSRRLSNGHDSEMSDGLVGMLQYSSLNAHCTASRESLNVKLFNTGPLRNKWNTATARGDVGSVAAYVRYDSNSNRNFSPCWCINSLNDCRVCLSSTTGGGCTNTVNCSPGLGIVYVGVLCINVGYRLTVNAGIWFRTKLSLGLPVLGKNGLVDKFMTVMAVLNNVKAK